MRRAREKGIAEPVIKAKKKHPKTGSFRCFLFLFYDFIKKVRVVIKVYMICQKEYLQKPRRRARRERIMMLAWLMSARKTASCKYHYNDNGDDDGDDDDDDDDDDDNIIIRMISL